MKILHLKNWSQVVRYNELYTIFFGTLIQFYGLVVKVTRMSRATLVRFRKMLKLAAAPGPFCVGLSPSVHWYARLYIAALCIFFFVGFRQWRSRADRVLSLNMNIWHALFWSTWSGDQSLDSATCAGLAHGRDYSNCREPWSKSDKLCLDLVFHWIVENTWNKSHCEGFSTPTPQTALEVKYCDSIRTVGRAPWQAWI